MRNPTEVLKSLTEKSKDESYRFQRLYRNLYNPEFYWLAYKNIYANKGGMTAGADGTTIDGMSNERINGIITSLRDRSYRPRPAKRVYIAKKNSNKKRPLGIQSGNDKLVQEIVKMILESIYEPAFSNKSHGFRPNRSCQTALMQIQKTFTGTNWFVEGDIHACFDSFDHHVIVEILKKRIDDEMFIQLIWKFLKAGYMEQWEYERTYSGVPQGSGVSPVLCNIYLNELDKFMEKYAIDFNTKAPRKRLSPAYKTSVNRAYEYRKEGKQLWEQLSPEERKIRSKRLRELERAEKSMTPTVPLDANYKRIQYTRYADDFLIGVIGSKEDAEQVKQDVKAFLQDALKLEMSDTKTKVTHTGDRARFLGYDITVSRSQKYSFPYIAGWSSDRNMKELRVSMDTIRRVSGEFIDQMVDRMQEIRREAQRHQENALFEEPQDRYGIYQLREDRDGTDYRFMGMAYLQEQGITVDGADYQFVYGDELQEGDVLEALYTKFNTDHPADYIGHPLSVSDVVVLKKDGELTAHYVDSFGYQELPEFIEQRKKAQEIQMEEKQAGQIGPETKGLSVEGHFGTWHTAEVKKIAGETFFRMEHDEHGDTVAGIIVDADGKLVAEDLEHGFDAGAMETITEYLYEKVPEPFIKQFYVVNDAYGVKAEREYQYFENLDEAIQAYHRLPNHLDKQLGMESREPVTSRMPLISCKNGIEEVEDIEKASLNGKWMNPEVTDAVNRAVYYLDNRDMEAAFSLTGLEQYFLIQTTDGGYDYTFYDAGCREIDGGNYENEDVSEQEAIEDILSGEAGGKPVIYKVMDVEAFLEQTEKAQEAAMEQTEPTISFYTAECMEFPVMGEYHDNLTLAEAFEKYQAIPAERMNGIKGIGFRLEDGSMYDGDYELMRAGSISRDMIDLVPHYKESPLVQKAMTDLEKMLAEERRREEPVQTEPAAEQGQDRPGHTGEKPEAEKPAGVRQSVLAALRERQAKRKAEEQQTQKETQKTEKNMDTGKESRSYESAV